MSSASLAATFAALAITALALAAAPLARPITTTALATPNLAAMHHPTSVAAERAYCVWRYTTRERRKYLPSIIIHPQSKRHC